VGRGRRSGWLRECPPACGLLLDVAKPQVHAASPTAAPSATRVCGLRCWHSKLARRIGLLGRSAQELLGSDTNFAATPCVAPHEPQARRIWALTPKTPGDSRGAECLGSPIHPQNVEQGPTRPHFGNDQKVTSVGVSPSPPGLRALVRPPGQQHEQQGRDGRGERYQHRHRGGGAHFAGLVQIQNGDRGHLGFGGIQEHDG